MFSDKFLFVLATAQAAQGSIIGQSKNLESAAQFGTNLKELLHRLYLEEKFETVVLQKSCRPSDDIYLWPFEFDNVGFIVSDNYTAIPTKPFCNTNMVAILIEICTPSRRSLETLAKTLNYIRWVRIILLLLSINEPKDNEVVVQYLQWCEELKFSNVMLLLEDSFKSGVYFTYTPFPKFSLERHALIENSSHVVLPTNRWRNMLGKVLLTCPDEAEPRNVIVKHPNGRIEINGYVGRFLKTFSEYHNCSLKIDHDLLANGSRELIRKAIRNGTLDIGGALSPPLHPEELLTMSHPLELVTWHVLLPVEPEVPRKYFIMRTFSQKYLTIMLIQSVLFTLLLTCVNIRYLPEGKRVALAFFKELINLKLNTLVALLGLPISKFRHSAPMAQFIYLQIILLGLVTTTSFATNLMTLLTSPPQTPMIKSYDDLLNRNLSILLPRGDVALLKSIEGFWDRYQHVFNVTDDGLGFQKRRRSYDVRSAYSISTSQWPPINIHQQYFQNKVYRLSDEMKIGISLWAIPLPRNSIYQPAMNAFVMRSLDSGLMSHWFSMSYADMLRIGRFKMEDPSQNFTKTRPYCVEDFQFLWTTIMVLWISAFLIFLVEIVFCKIFTKN